MSTTFLPYRSAALAWSVSEEEDERYRRILAAIHAVTLLPVEATSSGGGQCDRCICVY